jgi:tetraacyldisaccharide 4'-kinase
MAIARLLIARGERPVFLTRGYGGQTPGPSWVEDGPAAARRFGDEPLLLAAVAPTMVARDRRAGIIAIEGDRRPLSVVIMDDGLQNGSVTKDLSIALVDGKRGIGNGEVIPAGPLRAPLEFQIGLADAIVVRDPPDLADERGVHAVLRRGFPGPVLIGRVTVAGDTTWLKEKPVVAFAGIANPQRFYRLLESLGTRVVDSISFPDHHPFTASDAARLLETARTKGAQLVTTEKDRVRLNSDDALAALAGAARALPIDLTIDERDGSRLNSLIDAALQETTRRQRPPQP